MQRVEALVQKLNSQLAQKAEKASLKQTVLEILTVLEETNDFTVLPNSISVLMPFQTEVEHKIEDLAPTTVTPSPPSPTTAPTPTTIIQKEVKDQIGLEPIKNLVTAIGINDKFLFIETLFLGNEKGFEESIKTINSFTIYQEAQSWINQELRTKNNWEDDSSVVNQFDQLVKRRFS
jgi:hypothetical protein